MLVLILVLFCLSMMLWMKHLNGSIIAGSNFAKIWRAWYIIITILTNFPSKFLHPIWHLQMMYPLWDDMLVSNVLLVQYGSSRRLRRAGRGLFRFQIIFVKLNKFCLSKKFFVDHSVLQGPNPPLHEKLTPPSPWESPQVPSLKVGGNSYYQSFS